MASIREAFENVDAQSDFYTEQQVRYQEVEPNRFLPDKVKGNLGPRIVNDALAQFQKYDPYSETISNKFSAAGMSEILQGKGDTTEEEDYCRSFQGVESLPKVIADQEQDKLPIRCGWRYKRSPVGGRPLVSQGALGTINGPLNAKADPLGGGIEWIWDLKKALNRHATDYFSALPPTADGLRAAQAAYPDLLIGFCTATRQFIIVDSAGNPVRGFSCSAANIVRDPNRFPQQTQTAAGSLATENASQLTTCMTPGLNPSLGRDCLLQAIRTQGCSTDGTLYQAIEGTKASASTYNTFLLKQPSFQTYQSRQGGNQLTADLFRKDRGTWEMAVREIAKLSQNAGRASDPLVQVAARDLCLEAGTFDVYDFCSDLTDTAPIDTVELRCIQKQWQEENGKPAGLLYPSRKPLPGDLSRLTTWGAYKNFVTQLRAKTNSTDPIEQRNAIRDFLGVQISNVGFSPLNLDNIEAQFSIGANPCVFWVDAKDGGTITMDSQNRVSLWGDKSSNGRSTLSQPSIVNRPVYSSSGFPGLKFNGSSSFMEIPDAYAKVKGSYTIFLVERRTSGKSVNYPLGGTTVGQFNQNLVMGYHSLDTVRYTNWFRDLDGRIPAFQGTSEPTRVWAFMKTPGGKQIYLNGQLLKSDSAGENLGGWAGAAIGRYFTYYYDGVVHEVLIYNTNLSLDRRQKVEGYLANKWGISDALQAGHPYKINPP